MNPTTEPTTDDDPRLLRAVQEYLTELEAAVPGEHLARVRMVYGDSWLTSFDTILEVERQQRAKAKGAEAATPSPDEVAEAGS